MDRVIPKHFQKDKARQSRDKSREARGLLSQGSVLGNLTVFCWPRNVCLVGCEHISSLFIHVFCCMVNACHQKVLRFVFTLADRVHDSVIVVWWCQSA